MHEEHKGKMAVASKVKVETKDDLSTAYTPGVAEPCRKIKEDPENVYKYTNKSNIVAVVSDGSAVLGLGNIGGLASSFSAAIAFCFSRLRMFPSVASLASPFGSSIFLA